jgi:putative transposase
MKIKVQAHVAYQTQYHVVWISKRRRNILKGGIKEYLEKTIYSVIEDRYPDVFISSLNIQVDHVHALIEIPPKYAVSTVIGYIKGATSRQMRMHLELLRRMPSVWATGFFVSSVGINEEIIKRYITYQDKQERGQVLLPL